MAREKKSILHGDREEIAYLRQKISSLSLRGRYKECFRLIESKLKLLYAKERWPKTLVSVLRTHQRCFPSMNIDTPYEEYLTKLLRQNKIPVIFVELMRGGGNRVSWEPSFFQEKALDLLVEKQYDVALDYAELFLKTDPVNSNAHLVQGLILQETGKKREAAASYQRALELNPSNYQATQKLAELYLSTDLSKALEFIHSAMEQSSQDPQLYMVKARALAKQKDWDGALDALDQASSLDPLNPAYLYEKGEIYRLSGRNLPAIRQYGLALALDENHLPSLTQLAWLTEKDDPLQALRYTAVVGNAYPQDKEIALLWARLLERTGETQKAIAQYGRVLELDEDCHQAWAAWGELHLSTAPQQALDYFQKAARLKPESASYRMGIARCHRELGETQAALAAYQQAVVRDKKCHQAHAAMGILLMEQDHHAALQHFNRAIALAPQNPSYYYWKGKLLEKSSTSKQDILTCYHQAVQLDPADVELRVVLARLLEEMGREASAVEHYRAAVNLRPGREEAHRGLARLLVDSDPASALYHINKAISQNPNRADHYYLKSCIYINLGKDPQATSQLRVSLAGEQGHDDALQELAQLLDGDTPRVAMMYINRALEFAPDRPAYLCHRALLLEELGDNKNALAQYRAALELDPGCPRCHYGLGRLLGGKNDKDALEHLEKAEALDPANPLYTAEKARCLARDPLRYTQALDCFDEAIAKDKTRWEILLDKAKLLDSHDEALPAITHYRRVLLLAPDCLEANARMGALLADYNPRAALSYIQRAMELEPEHSAHRLWQGCLFYLLGEDKKGEHAVQEATRMEGDTGRIYRELVRILSYRQPQTALEYCDRLIALEPEQVEYLLLRGYILLAMNQLTQAAASYQRALDVSPHCHEALARIAEILYLEQNPQSLDAIDRALKLEENNPSYHFIRGMILEDLLEDASQAVIHVERAVALAPGNLDYRERLVGLLGKNRSHLARWMEKRKLGRLRRRMSKMEEEARQEHL
ncbi:MAG: tetratricopeptide repeat protein [Oscillospiraceae bacterium]